MKTAIIYYSKHHENTKKLLDAIKEAFPEEITLIDVTQTASADLTDYEKIGFASGIYFSKFDKRVISFAEACLPDKKDVFFLYTSGAGKTNGADSIKKAIAGKHPHLLGEYSCLGYDTYGPFKLIGGIAKDHPNSDEIQNAVEFYRNLNR